MSAFGPKRGSWGWLPSTYNTIYSREVSLLPRAICCIFGMKSAIWKPLLRLPEWVLQSPATFNGGLAVYGTWR